MIALDRKQGGGGVTGYVIGSGVREPSLEQQPWQGRVQGRHTGVVHPIPRSSFDSQKDMFFFLGF